MLRRRSVKAPLIITPRKILFAGIPNQYPTKSLRNFAGTPNQYPTKSLRNFAGTPKGAYSNECCQHLSKINFSTQSLFVNGIFTLQRGMFRQAQDDRLSQREKTASHRTPFFDVFDCSAPRRFAAGASECLYASVAASSVGASPSASPSVVSGAALLFFSSSSTKPASRMMKRPTPAKMKR